MAQTFRYEEHSATQLAGLDREKTLALVALSLRQVHDPHLPAGTDVLVALKCRVRIIERVRELWQAALQPAAAPGPTVRRAKSMGT